MAAVNGKTGNARTRRSTQQTVMIAALILNLCAQLVGFLAQLLLFGVVSMPLAIMIVLVLLAIGLVVTGKRWALGLSALAVLAESVLTVTSPGNRDALRHLGGPNPFRGVLMILIMVTAVVTISAASSALTRTDG